MGQDTRFRRIPVLGQDEPGTYIVYVGFLLIFAVFAVLLRDEGFLTASNLFNIVKETTPVTVMAIGMVFVLSAGEIDLSIGSVVAIAALLAAVVMRTHNWMLGVAVALGAGVTIGLINGVLVAYARLPSFLVTLATMGLLAGVARWITNLQSVPVIDPTFTNLFGSGSLFGIPSLVIWTVLAVSLGHYVYRDTPFGARVLATGDNSQAASAAGIKVDRLRLKVLVLGSTCAALAGLLYLGRIQSARYTLGETDLLTVIAAAVVGGTRLDGGTGTVLGALIGSLLMGMLNNGLILMGLAVSEQMIVRGLIILVAIVLTLREPRRAP
ncbi:MAG: ABC transporter permease [Verrucomicrobia bacterium]|nr:ABC transporter permease [Verrucomicrobiota bacterium]